MLRKIVTRVDKWNIKGRCSKIIRRPTRKITKTTNSIILIKSFSYNVRAIELIQFFCVTTIDLSCAQYYAQKWSKWCAMFKHKQRRQKIICFTVHWMKLWKNWKRWASSGIEPESNAPKALMIPLHQEAMILRAQICPMSLVLIYLFWFWWNVYC